MNESMPLPVHLSGSRFERPRHVCALFHSRKESQDTLLPFIREGFDHGDKAVHIVAPEERSRHLSWLEGAGIDIPKLGLQLQVFSWEETYLKDGHFDQDRQLALIERLLVSGKVEGYPLTRLVARMEWALEPLPGVDDLVEYETRLNYLLPKFDDAVV
jgi:hypothetical protein